MVINIQKLFFLLIFVLIASRGFTQFFEIKNYPQDYFAYPVDAKKSLSANFGELRPNHYHMGLDCRTDQVQNKKVVAAADGYISKVKIEPWGYGRAIYINHPNGLTTLYAHLNGFYPELEEYVKEQQYALKSWAVFIDIPADLFPVKKEMFIAYSGNTGGSMGPHLHFEIRDTKTDKVLNPSLFGFPIPDNVPPDIFKLAIYDRCISTYEQTPLVIKVKKINGVYVPTPSLIIAKTDKVSFGIVASDRYTGSANRNGIYETVLYDNEVPTVGFQLDSIDYDETRYINAHIDYTYRSKGGSYIQHVSKLPGFNNSLYKTGIGDGVIDIDDDSIHQIKLEVKDAYGNLSKLLFSVKRNPTVTQTKQQDVPGDFPEQLFRPGFVNLFENSNISFYLPENSLYDSIRFQFKEIPVKDGFTIFQLHHTGVPVHRYFPIRIKAETAFPDKMVMHRFANNKNDYAKAEPVSMGKDPGWYKASFRDFGSFQLMIDTVPPVITPIGFKDGMNCSKQSRLVFVINDNTEDLKNFTATLDGNWLRFSNDKGRRFIYDFDDRCAPGEHELKIVAEDMVGNITEKNYRFTR
ncbi:MAG: M23 family metallopeptidase [Chitinophagaceae bacterium]|nr:M23 family metallopeptidase [Chitinophagaceae bacterium]